MFGDNSGREASFEADAEDLAVAAPEFLNDLRDLHRGGTGDGADGVLEAWVQIVGHWQWRRMTVGEGDPVEKKGRADFGDFFRVVGYREGFGGEKV